jgi:type I restriction enzyme S subunit
MNASRLLENFDRLTLAPDAVGRLRRFVLDLAVRGKLVEQDPREGTAAELLALPKRSTKQAVAAKGLRRSFEDSERWCSIPVSWTFVRLGDIATVVMGSSPPGSSYNREGDGVPLINGPVEFTPGAFGRTVINQHTTAPTAFCEEGDFLICVRGSTTGRTNIASCRACIGRGVAAIQCNFPDAYIRHAICLQRDKILAMGRGIAFPSISRDQLLNLPIPHPPLAEQKRIVAKVDELMAICDQLEKQLETQQKESRRLLEALLHEALEEVG